MLNQAIGFQVAPATTGMKAKSNYKQFVPSTGNILFANTAIKELDSLVVERQSWENSEHYKKANEGLYSLLAKCLALYKTKFFIASEDDRKAVRQEIATRLIAANVRVQRNSTTLTMMIRYVFGSDRKRAHGYNYVLKAALSYDVTPEQLPKFIIDAGGIEEIKRKMVVSDEARKNKEEREKALLDVKQELELNVINPLGNVAIDLSANKSNYAIFITKPNEDGSSDIVAVLKDAQPNLVETLLKRIAKDNLAQQKEAQALKAETATLGVPSNDVESNKELLAA
jgi:hypothetical protein